MDIYLYTEKKFWKKMMNTKMLTDFFSGRQHYMCLSFPLNTFLYLGSKTIL